MQGIKQIMNSFLILYKNQNEQNDQFMFFWNEWINEIEDIIMRYLSYNC